MKIKRKLDKGAIVRTVLFSLLGVVGGIFFFIIPWLGGTLCIVGIIGTALFAYEGVAKEKRLQEQLDIHAGLMARAGVGNAYLESVVEELAQYGTYDRSWEALMHAVAIAPESGEVLTHLANATALSLSYLTELGIAAPREEFNRAEGIAKEAIRLTPQDHAAYSALGIIYDNMGKHEDARRLFLESRERGNVGWPVEVCTSYMMEGNPEAALREIEEAATRGVNLGWPLYFWLGACRMTVGKYEEARPALLAALGLHGHRYGIVRALGDLEFRTGKWLVSARYRIIEAGLVWPVSKSRAVVTLAGALGQVGAIVACRISAAVSPLTRRIGPVFRFQCRHIPPFGPEEGIAMLAWKDGNIEAGLGMMEKALAVAPQWPNSWANKALFLGELGRYDEASECLERALKSEPENPVWLHNYEQLKLSRAGKLAKTRRRVVHIGRQRGGWFRVT